MKSLTRQLPLALAMSAVAYAIALGLAARIFDGFVAEAVWLVAAVVIFMVLTVALRRVVLATVERFVRVYTLVGGLALTFAADRSLCSARWLRHRGHGDVGRRHRPRVGRGSGFRRDRPHRSGGCAGREPLSTPLSR